MASMKGRRPLNRHRSDLNRRSSRPKRIFFDGPKTEAVAALFPEFSAGGTQHPNAGYKLHCEFDPVCALDYIKVVFGVAAQVAELGN
jgi:hypothetical protein